MATVGQALTSPEQGWKRINHSNNNIQYFGSDWLFNESSHYVSSGLNPEQLKLNTVKLVFYGTKFRLIGSRYLNYSSDLKIIIDNVEENVSVYSPTVQENILNYEKIGLSLGNHTVEIISNDGLRYNVASVDVDDTGYMLHPILSRKTSLAEMQIGDYIPCRYTASSGAVGVFSELGSCNMAEIPLNGSATPNGLFNFIKVDKGLLIADRVVQHSISWNTLNSGRFIEGKLIQQQSLLLHLDTGTEDANNSKNVSVVGNASMQPDTGVFGGGSMYFDGSQSYILVQDTPELNVEGDDFTIELWIKPLGTGDMTVFEKRDISTTYGASDGMVIIISSANNLSGNFSTNGSSWTAANVVLGTGVVRGQWNHIAFCRTGNTFYGYVNGVRGNALNMSGAFPSNTHPFKIGSYSKGYNHIYGWLNEFRFIKGKALYTENFTPPTARFGDSDVQPLIIRSLTGGVAYANDEGKSAFSLTDKGFGAFPNNEWDKYIVNSNLGGAITAGDNNIWNINEAWSWTLNTPITGTWTPSIGSPTAAANTSRIGRGNLNASSFPDIWFGVSTTSATTVGFRPVLQYTEPDGSTKQTTLWY